VHRRFSWTLVVLAFLAGLVLATAVPSLAAPPRPGLCSGLAGDGLTRCLYSDLDDRLRALETPSTPTPTPTSTTPRPSTTSTPTPTPTSTPSTRRVLWGTSGENGKSQANYENYAGRPVGVRREFYLLSSTSAVASITRDVNARRLPWPTFKWDGYTWAQVANGAADARMRTLRDQLIALNAEIWIGFHHEPEGDENVAGQTDAQIKANHGRWREAQRRAAAIFAERPSKLKYWLVTTGWHQEHNPVRVAQGLDWNNLYPTGAQIYGIAYDAYKLTPDTNVPVLYMSRLKTEAGRRGDEWGLAETGIDTADFQREPGWFRTMHDYMRANGGLALAYFDTTLNSTKIWTLGPWPNAKAQAFAEELKRS
jgi:hypothetical protein